jgi:hypothetical protein
VLVCGVYHPVVCVADYFEGFLYTVGDSRMVRVRMVYGEVVIYEPILLGRDKVFFFFDV